jgi:hypothetical protein
MHVLRRSVETAAESVLCKVARTAQSCRLRSFLTLQRSLLEADIGAGEQHFGWLKSRFAEPSCRSM